MEEMDDEDDEFEEAGESELEEDGEEEGELQYGSSVREYGDSPNAASQNSRKYVF